MSVIRGANAPLLNKTITEQLAYEHKVLEGNAERKEVSTHLSNVSVNLFSIFFHRFVIHCWQILKTGDQWTMISMKKMKVFLTSLLCRYTVFTLGSNTASGSKVKHEGLCPSLQ